MVAFGLLLVPFVSAQSVIAPNQGWTQLSNTALAPICPGYAEIHLNEGCTGVVNDWGSGLFDPHLHRFVLPANGGHGGYAGNEVYYVDFSTNPPTRVLQKDATHNPATFCDSDATSVNSPSSRHVYDGARYIDQLRKYFLQGDFFCAISNPDTGTDQIWLFDPTTSVFDGQSGTGWTHLTLGSPHPNHATNGSVPQFAYYWGDETHQPAMYEVEANTAALWIWNPVTNVYTSPASVSPSTACTSHGSGYITAIDPIRRFYLCVGSGDSWRVNLDSPFTTTHIAMTGCNRGGFPGVAYDPVNRDFAIWPGSGTTVYFWNPDTDTCTSDTPATGPPNPDGSPFNGMYGRWQYDAYDGIFVEINSMNFPVWAYRRATVATLQQTDWTKRSTAAGVVVAQGFDSAGSFALQTGNTTGIHASVSNGSVMTLDTTNFTSGGGSMKCVVPAQTGPDACGAWWQFLSHTFVNGETMYVQFRQKFDANVLNQHPKAGDGSTTYFKQVIFANTVVATGSPSTCGNPELTTINDNDKGYPLMYTNCGSARTPDPLVEITLGGGSDFLKEQGDNSTDLGAAQNTGYNCHFQTANNNANSCANYPAGVWVTYYYKIQIGTFGSANSTIQAWRALPGEPYQEWANVSGFLLNIDSGTTNGYNFLDLLNYYTNRNGGVAFGSTGTTWYDELIVSTQPIAVPMAPTIAAAGGPTLAPPTNLRAVPITHGQMYFLDWSDIDAIVVQPSYKVYRTNMDTLYGPKRRIN